MVLAILQTKRKSLQQARGFYMLKSNAVGSNDNDSRSETKAALYDQIQQCQSQNSELVKQIGKLIRQFGTGKPIKLNLSGLISSQSLDFVLSGIKNNSVVQELNLGDNLLNDEDLTKICQRLRAQSPENFSIKRLKLQANDFREPWPFIDLLSECGHNFVHLDISQMIFAVPQAVQLLATSMSDLSNLQELALCSLDMFTDGDEGSMEGPASILFESISKLQSLRCLDLSKNKLPSSLIIKMCSVLPALNRLQVLALSSINMGDESVYQLCQMLMKLRSLKKLNISNNISLSAGSITEIIRSIKTLPELQDLDLSKLQCSSVSIFTELAELLMANRRLKCLSMQRTGMTDALANYLTEPLLRAQQIETLRFDFNELTGVFLEKYCRKVAMIGFSQSLHGPGNGIDRNASASILASDSEEMISARTGQSQNNNF